MKDLNEIQDAMKGLGIPTGVWGDTPSAGHEVQLQVLERQKDALLRLRAMLEGMVESDRQTTRILREQLSKLEHGGGS